MMQQEQNPDVNSVVNEDEYGNRSDIERENESGETSETDIPLPPTEPKPAPVEEPPDPEGASIDEPGRKPTQIV